MWFVHKEDVESTADVISKRQKQEGKKSGSIDGREVMVFDRMKNRIHAERTVVATTAMASSGSI